MVGLTMSRVTSTCSNKSSELRPRPLETPVHTTITCSTETIYTQQSDRRLGGQIEAKAAVKRHPLVRTVDAVMARSSLLRRAFQGHRMVKRAI